MELHSAAAAVPAALYPTHTPSSIEYAGRHGFHFVGLGPAAAVREHTEAYRGHGGRTSTIRLGSTAMSRLRKIGILRLVVIATATASGSCGARRARDLVSLDYPTVARTRRPQHRRLFSWESSLATKSLVYGAPGRVREDIRSSSQRRLQLCHLLVRLGTLSSNRAFGRCASSPKR